MLTVQNVKAVFVLEAAGGSRIHIAPLVIIPSCDVVEGIVAFFEGIHLRSRMDDEYRRLLGGLKHIYSIDLIKRHILPKARGRLNVSCDGFVSVPLMNYTSRIDRNVLRVRGA